MNLLVSIYSCIHECLRVSHAIVLAVNVCTMHDTSNIVGESASKHYAYSLPKLVMFGCLACNVGLFKW